MVLTVQDKAHFTGASLKRLYIHKPTTKCYIKQFKKFYIQCFPIKKEMQNWSYSNNLFFKLKRNICIEGLKINILSGTITL
jgi:hypothetical protein